jgi:Protein ChrB, N-terminal
MNVGAPRTLAHSWLLLVHQLPAKPAYLRVKIWRRLQDLGAIAVKNAVHALPMNEETQEDFEWLLREIREGGGEAFLCEARLIDGLSDEEVRALFDRARDADYAELVKDARALVKSLRPNARSEALAEFRVSRRGGFGRFLRRHWSRNSGRLDQKSRGAIERGRGRDGESDGRFRGEHVWDASQQDLGHATRRIRRSHCQRLVDTAFHRP